MKLWRESEIRGRRGQTTEGRQREAENKAGRERTRREGEPDQGDLERGGNKEGVGKTDGRWTWRAREGKLGSK